MLFGYKLKDHLPNKFRTLRKEWKDLMKVRELQGLKKERQVLLKTGNRRTLKPLNEGDIVSVQNQTGNQPLKWSNTGVIVKVHPHRQYSVMIHASRRVTLRNRKFLRKLDLYSHKPKLPTIPQIPCRRQSLSLQQECINSPPSSLAQPNEPQKLPLNDFTPLQPLTCTPQCVQPSELTPTHESTPQPEPISIDTPPICSVPDITNLNNNVTQQANREPRISTRKKTMPKRYIEEC